MVPTVLRGPGTGGRWRQHQRGWQVADPVDVRPLGLGQPPAAVGAQGLQETVHALGVEGADGQGGLAGAGDADDGHGPPQRDVHVEIAQVVVPGAAHFDGGRQRAGHGQPRVGARGRGEPAPSVECAARRAHLSIVPVTG
jgi:hypothetical protein